MILWLGIFGITLLLALLLGRVYCGWMCPMNTLMLPTAWLSKKLNLQAKIAPNWLKSNNCLDNFNIDDACHSIHKESIPCPNTNTIVSTNFISNCYLEIQTGNIS